MILELRVTSFLGPGPRFGSQNLPSGSEPTLSLVEGDLMPISDTFYKECI